MSQQDVLRRVKELLAKHGAELNTAGIKLLRKAEFSLLMDLKEAS